MQPSIESLEKRLSEIELENLPEEAQHQAELHKKHLQEKIAEMKLADAESWADRDWLNIVEGLFDEIGRIVDQALFGEDDKQPTVKH